MYDSPRNITHFSFVWVRQHCSSNHQFRSVKAKFKLNRMQTWIVSNIFEALRNYLWILMLNFFSGVANDILMLKIHTQASICILKRAQSSLSNYIWFYGWLLEWVFFNAYFSIPLHKKKQGPAGFPDVTRHSSHPSDSKPGAEGPISEMTFCFFCSLDFLEIFSRNSGIFGQTGQNQWAKCSAQQDKHFAQSFADFG